MSFQTFSQNDFFHLQTEVMYFSSQIVTKVTSNYHEEHLLLEVTNIMVTY